MLRCLLPLALLLSLLLAPSAAQAAECTEIGPAPTIIVAPGSYCLAQSVSVGFTSGSFVVIDADDVQLDCRGMTIHSTQTNPASNVYAVYVQNRRGVSVRDCNITGGWAAGIYAYQDNTLANTNKDLSFTDNHIRGAYWYGILAWGTGIEIARNRITGIGGRASFAMGVRVGGSNVKGESRLHVVRDNVISGVVAQAGYGYGIFSHLSNEGVFADNVIVGVESVAPTRSGQGIRLEIGYHNRITGNHIIGNQAGDFGIGAPSTNACYHNHLDTLSYTVVDCDTSNGNY